MTSKPAPLRRHSTPKILLSSAPSGSLARHPPILLTSTQLRSQAWKQTVPCLHVARIRRLIPAPRLQVRPSNQPLAQSMLDPALRTRSVALNATRPKSKIHLMRPVGCRHQTKNPARHKQSPPSLLAQLSLCALAAVNRSRASGPTHVGPRCWSTAAQAPPDHSTTTTDPSVSRPNPWTCTLASMSPGMTCHNVGPLFSTTPEHNARAALFDVAEAFTSETPISCAMSRLTTHSRHPIVPTAPPPTPPSWQTLHAPSISGLALVQTMRTATLPPRPANS